MPSAGAEHPEQSADGRELLHLTNVGKAIARRFVSIGITSIEQLRGRNAMDVFTQMQAVAGHPEDPCLLDAVMSAVDQAEGKPARPWWTYTDERKRMLDEVS